MIKYLIGVVISLIALFFAAAYYCYREAFAVPKKYRTAPEDFPGNDQYDPLKEQMIDMIKTASAIPFEEVYIQTEDGLTLFGRYYETRPGAPVEILFHGYRSNALRDFSGGLQLALSCGCNALLVDQRAHGKSQGRCLSFGINERLDCREWVRYISNRFGKDTSIVLTGISMGAATVMMASDLEMPGNVVGIIADCGYTSPSEIIAKVIKETNYPNKAGYAFVRIGGRIFGGFDIEKYSATEALRHTNIPILMVHGEDDHFVPCEMSRKNYAACTSQKELLTVPGAGHGISYMIDYDAYSNATKAFLRRVGIDVAEERYTQ